jgi:hypothetical protein
MQRAETGPLVDVECLREWSVVQRSDEYLDAGETVLFQRNVGHLFEFSRLLFNLSEDWQGKRSHC